MCKNDNLIIKSEFNVLFCRKLSIFAEFDI